MILPIVLWPDPVLTRKAADVVIDDSVRQLVADMFETMYAAPGRGLAAPQVGQSQRLFVMDVGWRDGTPEPRVFINPVILAVGAELAVHDEGCLSLPGFSLPVLRPLMVRMRWQGLDGVWVEEDLRDFAAICAQHEFDHLDGVLTIDRSSEAALAGVAGPLAALQGVA